jgi:hypothetical protein
LAWIAYARRRQAKNSPPPETIATAASAASAACSRVSLFDPVCGALDAAVTTGAGVRVVCAVGVGTGLPASFPAVAGPAGTEASFGAAGELAGSRGGVG